MCGKNIFESVYESFGDDGEKESLDIVKSLTIYAHFGYKKQYTRDCVCCSKCVRKFCWWWKVKKKGVQVKIIDFYK